MEPGTFSVGHFTDMLEKAKRELTRFKNTPDLDHALNFFITVYHVYDYVKVHVPDYNNRALMDTFFKPMFDDDDFDVCHQICNKAKHLRLDFGEYKTDSEMGVTSGAVPGKMVLGTGSAMLGTAPRPILFVDGKEQDFEPLAQRLMEKWETFLRSKGLIT